MRTFEVNRVPARIAVPTRARAPRTLNNCEWFLRLCSFSNDSQLHVKTNRHRACSKGAEEREREGDVERREQEQQKRAGRRDNEGHGRH